MRRITEAFIGLLLALNTQAACGSPSKQTPAAPTPVQTAAHPGTSEGGDSELVKEINAFAEGEGNETVLRSLKERPRDSLVASLKRIRDNAGADDPIRVKTAFLLCRLGHSYSENRPVVVGAFENPRKYEGFYKDDAAGMLASLIREGDKDLLPVLFAASEGSDGALAEELSAVFVENVRENPEAFLRQLSGAKAGVRKEVYKLVSFSILSADDLNRVKASLSNVPAQSKEHAAAEEMLLFLDDEARRKT